MMGKNSPLSPRTFDTLAFFVKNSPNLVTIEELIAEVWNDVTVEPNNVTQHVFSARRALGDNSQNPTYIQNVPRRGYRFIALVEKDKEDGPPVVDEVRPPLKKRRDPLVFRHRGIWSGPCWRSADRSAVGR